MSLLAAPARKVNPHHCSYWIEKQNNLAAVLHRTHGFQSVRLLDSLFRTIKPHLLTVNLPQGPTDIPGCGRTGLTLQTVLELPGSLGHCND